MLDLNLIEHYHCPRWHELPSIPLYMDQVVMIIHHALGIFFEESEPSITASMIHNYVKQKIIHPPQKKKYQKEHIVQLIMISTFKKIFSISEISALLSVLVDELALEDAYDLFCSQLEHTLALGFHSVGNTLTLDVSSVPSEQLLHTALLAFVSKLLAQHSLKQLNPPTPLLHARREK